MYINIKDGEENHIFNEDNFGDQSLKVRIESQNKDILTINEDEDGDFRILTDGIGTSDLKYKVQTESVSDDDNTILKEQFHVMCMTCQSMQELMGIMFIAK